MKLIDFLIFALLIAVSVPQTHAAGGKVQENNPILGDGCIFSVPNGIIDTENCEEITLPDSSLPQMFSCDTVVICVEESTNPGVGNNK